MGIAKQSPIHVLHVDDETGILKVAKQILELQGIFQVDSASSVEEAFAKMKQKDFDVIVSDYQMPIKDGLQFIKELRDNKNNIPFILFTGKGREEVVIEALNIGVDYYINKLGRPETVYGELSHAIFQVVKNQKSERMLIESEKKYRILFENMLEGFAYCKIILNEKNKPVDFVYLEINDTFEKITGLKRETIVGKRVSEAIPETIKNYPELLETYSRVALTGKEEQFDIHFKPLDIWLNISVYSPKKEYFVAVFENTTERKKAEVEIMANEEKFYAISNSSQDAIILIDANETISFWNPSAEKIFGYTQEEVFGKNLHKLLAPKRFHKDYLKGFTEFKKNGKGPAIGNTLELAAIKKNGKEFPIELSLSAFKLNDNWCSVGTIRDITEREIAWKSLDSTINQLSLINEKLGVVGRLTRHDVRNKLSAVTGNIYLAKQALSPDSEIVKYLNETESAVDQIEQIFDFARIYEQLGVEELSYVDVGKSFDSAVSLVPSNNGVDFVNECKGLMVLADSLFSQLMFTMIDNSLRHGEKVNRIRIHHKVVDDKLKIFIEDDGVGIPKEEKEIIFKDGYGKNSGLGLHLVKLMCEVYGWKIQETGTQGIGAHFTITLPKKTQK